jgi:hypothetical protein
MKPNEYKCPICGNIYEKGWDDELAIKEFIETFGPLACLTAHAVICDDCYRKIIPSLPNFNRAK